MHGQVDAGAPMKTVEMPQTRCRAGVARGDITPPVGIYHRLWGAAVPDRAPGIHGPPPATLLSRGPPAGTPALRQPVAPLGPRAPPRRPSDRPPAAVQAGPA